MVEVDTVVVAVTTAVGADVVGNAATASAAAASCSKGDWANVVGAITNGARVGDSCNVSTARCKVVEGGAGEAVAVVALPPAALRADAPRVRPLTSVATSSA